ncbi:MAG: signal recognition particle-docking protein FtsY [Lentisphaerae bacterium]|nr:signal recognition particle-docking protein FtsY [Lentisphaerota bacterium]MBQ9804612.1 signal recognition particle-docking protein FtsY [Lentisphaeria bacterium]
MSIFSIFKRGLEKSATKLSRVIGGVFTGIKAHGSASFEDLEAMLIAADFGVAAAKKVVAGLRDRYERGKIATDADLVQVARDEVATILKQGMRPIRTAPENEVLVILMVGVNGSGKTTTIGKLAAKWQQEGKKVILGACDTFRAAAVEQLQLWGERTGCQVVSAKHGADPASVAFDATMAAKSRNADILLIDTAGRQQNQQNLMAELNKICRSIGKVLPGAPHEVWLTVDASLGSNVISQAREFGKTAGVSGLILTKLDGTGRGGMAVALHEEFGLPTFFAGFGEAPEDLQEFDPDFYADALFGMERQ